MTLQERLRQVSKFYIDGRECAGGNRHITWADESAQAADRIDELEEALWLLVGDVEAMHRSHVPGPGEPPITRDEIYHRDRAKALLAGYQPKEH